MVLFMATAAVIVTFIMSITGLALVIYSLVDNYRRRQRVVIRELLFSIGYSLLIPVMVFNFVGAIIDGGVGNIVLYTVLLTIALLVVIVSWFVTGNLIRKERAAKADNAPTHY